MVDTAVLRHAEQDEQEREPIDYVHTVQPTIDADRQTIVDDLVDVIEHALFSDPFVCGPP